MGAEHPSTHCSLRARRAQNASSERFASHAIPSAHGVRWRLAKARRQERPLSPYSSRAFGYSQLAVNASQHGWLVVGEGVVAFGSTHVLGASETVGSAHMPTQAHRSPSSHRPRSPVIDDPHACFTPRIPMHAGSIRIVSDEICITHCSSHCTLSHVCSSGDAVGADTQVRTPSARLGSAHMPTQAHVSSSPH
jgi:hypothetical protein